MGQNLFDQYTFLHFSVGVVMYFIGFRLAWTIILHIVFEFVENTNEGINVINNYLSWFWPGGIIAGWLAAKCLDDIVTQRNSTS